MSSTRWGNKLVMVGSQTIRESILLPSTCPPNLPIGIHQYCMLERIGRARFNGEVTTGKHSSADPNEPQNFFHLRFVGRRKLHIFIHNNNIFMYV